MLIHENGSLSSEMVADLSDGKKNRTFKKEVYKQYNLGYIFSVKRNFN